MNVKIQQPFSSVWFYFPIFSIHFLAYPSFCVHCTQLITICCLQHQWKTTKRKSLGIFTHVPHPGWHSSQVSQGRLRIDIRGGKKGCHTLELVSQGGCSVIIPRETLKARACTSDHSETWFSGGLGQHSVIGLNHLRGSSQPKWCYDLMMQVQE